MGAWSDLVLADTTLAGLAGVDMMDSDGVFDATKKVTEVTNAAKRYIETRLIRTMPDFVARVEGSAVFLDAVAGEDEIDNLMQEVLGWAYLIRWYKQEAFTTADQFHQKMTAAIEEFNVAFDALVSYLRHDDEFITALESDSAKSLKQYNAPIHIA